MLIDLTDLMNNNEKFIDINEVVTFDPKYYSTTDIRGIKPVKVTGSISKNDGEIYNININMSGEMILPCAITLADVNFPFNINYDSDITDENENMKIIGNYLDIIPIIWENVVAEIPLRVVAPNAKLKKVKGDGWQLITDDSKKENQFAVLKDLYKKKEDE